MSIGEFQPKDALRITASNGQTAELYAHSPPPPNMFGGRNHDTYAVNIGIYYYVHDVCTVREEMCVYTFDCIYGIEDIYWYTRDHDYAQDRNLYLPGLTELNESMRLMVIRKRATKTLRYVVKRAFINIWSSFSYKKSCLNYYKII